MNNKKITAKGCDFFLKVSIKKGNHLDYSRNKPILYLINTLFLLSNYIYNL